MYRSTLPDLFKADLMTIKFHPQDRPQKIGGRFSIRLPKNSSLGQSPQKSMKKLQSHATLAMANTIYDGVNSKYRSHSINNLPPAIKYNSSARNSLGRAKKSVGFSQCISDGRKHSESVTRDAPTLQQIHYQNLTKSKATPAKQQMYGFPYQTTRTMNNMQVQLQEADSFKNKVDIMIQEQKQSEKAFVQIIKETIVIKEHLHYFHQAYLYDLQEFNQHFKLLCHQSMKTLSKLRRETSQETKSNAFDIQRVSEDYHNAQNIFNVLEQNSNLLRNQCLPDQKLQLTNRKTYTQDLQLKIYNSVRQSDLDKLFKRSKRTETSHSLRPKGPSLPINIQSTQRAQTSSYQRKFSQKNAHNFQEQRDDLLYTYQGTKNQQGDEDSLEIDRKPNHILNLQETVFQDY